MATTTNFGWTTPNDTDLVKDGAAAIRTLGSSIDTSMAQLKGGTTGQVLSKTSNTDMAFTWVAQDDSNAIQNALVDAKGDLIAATANDTPARLAVGNNGETLVADSSATTGLRYQSNFAAGKNKIINGDFGIWQRGTTFSNPSSGQYFADRVNCFLSGTGQTRTISQQAFTPGTAPVAGYEGKYFLRYNQSVSGTSPLNVLKTSYIEDVQTFAGQTVTFSYWAKVGTATSHGALTLYQVFGSGGSSQVTQTIAAAPSYTTDWVRYSYTFTVPSIAGKTIGTGSYISIDFNLPSTGTFTFDIWGLQWEAGNTATAFQTATGTIQGELAACQRYYYRTTALNSSNWMSHLGTAGSTTTAYVSVPLKTTMRVFPTAIDYASLRLFDAANPATAVTALIIDGGNSDIVILGASVASGLTQFRPYYLLANTTPSYYGLSAEL